MSYTTYYNKKGFTGDITKFPDLKKIGEGSFGKVFTNNYINYIIKVIDLNSKPGHNIDELNKEVNNGLKMHLHNIGPEILAAKYNIDENIYLIYMDKYDGDVGKYITNNIDNTKNIKIAIREQFNIVDRMILLSKEGKVPMCTDVKPGNFVYRIRDGKLEIKMIDFGSDFCFDDIDLSFLEEIDLEDLVYITLLSNIIKFYLKTGGFNDETITDILLNSINVDYFRIFCSNKREIIQNIADYYDKSKNINPKISAMLWYFTGLQTDYKSLMFANKLYEQYDEICNYIPFIHDIADNNDINLFDIISANTPRSKNMVRQIYRHLAKCGILPNVKDIYLQRTSLRDDLISKSFGIDTRCFILGNFLGIIIYYVDREHNLININKICLHHKYKKQHNIVLSRYIMNDFLSTKRNYNIYTEFDVDDIGNFIIKPDITLTGSLLIEFGFIPSKYVKTFTKYKIRFITNPEISENIDLDNRKHQLLHFLMDKDNFNIILPNDLYGKIDRLIRENIAENRIFYLNLNNMVDNYTAHISTNYIEKDNEMLGYTRATLQIGWKNIDPFIHFLDYSTNYPRLLLHLWYQPDIGLIIISTKQGISDKSSYNRIIDYVQKTGVVYSDDSGLHSSRDLNDYRALQYELNQDINIPVKIDLCESEIIEADIECHIENIHLPPIVIANINNYIISGINLRRIDRFSGKGYIHQEGLNPVDIDESDL